MSDDERCPKTMESKHRPGHTHTCRTKPHEGSCVCVCGALFGVFG